MADTKHVDISPAVDYNDRAQVATQPPSEIRSLEMNVFEQACDECFEAFVVDEDHPQLSTMKLVIGEDDPNSVHIYHPVCYKKKCALMAVDRWSSLRVDLAEGFDHVDLRQDVRVGALLDALSPDDSVFVSDYFSRTGQACINIDVDPLQTACDSPLLPWSKIPLRYLVWHITIKYNSSTSGAPVDVEALKPVIYDHIQRSRSAHRAVGPFSPSPLLCVHAWSDCLCLGVCDSL